MEATSEKRRKSIQEFLVEQDIPGIEGIDTEPSPNDLEKRNNEWHDYHRKT